MPSSSGTDEPQFLIESLGKEHDRSRFACGNERIDAYFRQAVSQDIKRQYATCFVARPADSSRVAAFYTLSASSVPVTEVPEPLARKLPRYPTVPAILIGWLARDLDYSGFGLGEAMLFDAIRTVASAPIGAHAVFADAIDDRASAFYRSYGFTPLTSRSATFYLPLAAAKTLVR
ncbi:GNAT family N-acetyltransferase [Kumtagia ephedrae]|jgi:ribosomal protein S18 acetylase RimI-like enzyme|uniref:GNAT family N-acetyltransferase n=1 Tax=Kumtagia ephedrae TaxID=2116701 RepID=A0A2P7SC16_9HYPH|nr:GNAT family N-acetyltransferase [Mesorhizobium ephedrae]PSJ60047.1 GNAT family N-acetyltransferase [Mesorhizobium ephedrae]